MTLGGNHMIIKRTPLALVAASALLLLAGCSGGGSSAEGDANAAAPTAESSATSQAATQESSAPAGDQSKAEACEIVTSSFSDVTEASGSIDTTDPQAALAGFKDLAAKVDSNFSQITNAEVAPAAQNASASLNEYVTFLEGVIADPSTASGISEQVTALQESFTEAGTACAG